MHNIDVEDEKKYTALVYSIISGQQEITEMILAHGADPNRKFASLTILTWAAIQDNSDILKMLIKYGACMDALNRSENFFGIIMRLP